MANTHFEGPVVSSGGFVGALTGNVLGNLVGDVQGRVLTRQEITADGAISIANGLVILNKAGAIAATLASPAATTDDGKLLVIVSITAQAHTVTLTAGFNGGGASKDVATFGGAIGDGLVLVAYQGKWYILTSTNITLG